MKVTIEHYISTNNPAQAQAILAKYGVRAKNMPDLIRKMHKVMQVKGEEAVKDFAAIDTPYKQMLLSTITKPTEKKSGCCGSSSADGEESSNACGCSGADGEQTSGCDGNGVCTCGKKQNMSNAEGDKKVVTTAAPIEAKVEAKTEEAKTEPVKLPKEALAPIKEKTDMMPFVIVGAVALIAVVVIAKS
jgi:cobalamin biosynthesis Mg chelatase CobN